MVLQCGDGLFGPRAAERTCSEGPSPISPCLCGGGAGGSFGNLGAAHSLSLTQHYRQWYDRHHYLSQSLHPCPMYLEYRSSYSYSSNSSAD